SGTGHRSDTMVNASAAIDAANGLSPLTIAAQNDDRDRDLFTRLRRSHQAVRRGRGPASRWWRAGYLIDQVNAAKALDDAPGGEDAGRHAAEVCHRAPMRRSCCRLRTCCPGQPAEGDL